MLTARTMMDNLCLQILGCYASVPGVFTTGPNKNVIAAPGWPSVTALSSVSKGGPSIINIYDKHKSKDTTRWMPEITSKTDSPNYLSGSFDTKLPGPGGTAILTVSSTATPPVIGNALAVLFTQGISTNGVAVTVIANDTLATVCARLAKVINAHSVISAWVSARAVDNTVLLTNLLSTSLQLDSSTVAYSVVSTEIHREERFVQINTWTKTEQTRELISEPIAKLIYRLQRDFGFSVNGDWVRVKCEGDIFMEDDLLKDVYRRVFLLTVEFGDTVEDDVYPVLVYNNLLEAGPNTAE